MRNNFLRIKGLHYFKFSSLKKIPEVLKAAVGAKNKEWDKARLKEGSGDLGELIFEFTEESAWCRFNTASLSEPPLLCKIRYFRADRAIEEEPCME